MKQGKRRFSWSQDLQYIFDGGVIDFDDTGNIVYGVLATAADMSDFIMQAGTGVVNAYEALRPPFENKDWERFIETLEREISWIFTYFDDPQDNEAIKLGVEYYYKI